MPNVLVTGATGFIGKALCRRMLTEGWHVRATIRSFAKKDVLPKGVEIVEIGTIDSDTEWGATLDGIDAVIHLAARVHVMEDRDNDKLSLYRKLDVEGTKRLAQTALSKIVRRFVYISSIKVNGEGKLVAYTENDKPLPVGPYGTSKFETERILKKLADKSNLEVVILRPPLVYGPEVKANFLKLIKLVHKRMPLPLATVKNLRSLIYIENFVDAIFTCTIHPNAAGKTFLVSDGQDMSTPDLIQNIASALGKPSRLLPFPPLLLHVLARLTGKSEIVRKLADSLIIDSSRIRAELNWVPPFSPETGIKETIEWYLQAFK